jgi:tyrosyl-tRNA synthetase
MKKTIKLTELTPKIRNLPDLLVEVKLCKSRNEARREIEGDGITLNGSKLSKVYFDKPIVEVFNENKLNGNYILIKKGKKNFYLIKISN